MKVLVTGADGFIGKNICRRFDEINLEYYTHTRENSEEELFANLKRVDFVFHFAGENRPTDQAAFSAVNVGLTKQICEQLEEINRQVPILFSSSIHAVKNTEYGKSKAEAEAIIKEYSKNLGVQCFIYRLPGVFGKWAKPNYNSVVATFSHNICNGIPTTIHDPNDEVSLVYIDDVVFEFLKCLKFSPNGSENFEVKPIYKIKISDLADLLRNFENSRRSLVTEHVGTGLTRKLYATYLSYLAPADFSYTVPSFTDERGVFAEVLKTKESGQFSFFTAKPQVSRGGHYHHTKSEKFLVVQGKARFQFRNLAKKESFELFTDGTDYRIVETIPGWWHNITNIGDDTLVVLLWANEIFDKENADTFTLHPQDD